MDFTYTKDCSDRVRDRIYDYIKSYKAEHDGVAPSRRDILEALALNSLSLVNYHLECLADEGRIVLGGNRESRWIEIVGARWIPPNGRAV